MEGLIEYSNNTKVEEAIDKITIALPDTNINKELLSNYNISHDKINNLTLVEIDNDNHCIKQLFDNYYGEKTNKITTLDTLLKETNFVKTVSFDVPYNAICRVDNEENYTIEECLEDWKKFADMLEYEKVTCEQYDDYEYPIFEVTIKADDKIISDFIDYVNFFEWEDYLENY